MEDKVYNDERLIDNPLIDSQIENEHRHRYYMAARYTNGKTVLDVACGSGYGTEILSVEAQKVIGIDYSSEIIAYCKATHIKDNLEFKQMKASNMDFPSQTFDVVVSFETLEHLSEDEQIQFLKEIKRVLKIDGLLIISTPNCMIWETTINNGKNNYHLHELEQKEFEDLIKSHFDFCRFFAQNYGLTSNIVSEQERELGIIYSKNYSDVMGAYSIAFCTNSSIIANSINKIKGSIYFSNGFQNYAEQTFGFCDMSLYCDTGNGFCEADKIKTPFNLQYDGKLKVEFNIKRETYALRFDPGEKPCCIFGLKCLTLQCDWSALNGVELEDEKYVFAKDDPIFVINIEKPLQQGEQVVFTFFYKEIDKEFDILYQENLSLKQKNKELSEKFETIGQKLDQTKNLYTTAQKQLVSYYSENTQLQQKLSDLESEIEYRKEKLRTIADSNDGLIHKLNIKNIFASCLYQLS